MTRYLPYLLPIGVTLVCVSFTYLGVFWAVFLVFPFLSFFTKFLGKFSTQEILDEYIFFHKTPGMEVLRGFSGLFFLGFNLWMAFFLVHHQLEWFNLLFFIYGAVLINSNFAVSLAHELMHSHVFINRLFSTLILLINGFFYLEMDHLFIHHRHVGTLSDPASALKGEPLYTYLLRSVSGRIKILFFGDESLPTPKRRRIRRNTVTRLVACLFFLWGAFSLNLQYFFGVLAQFVFVTLLYEVVTYVQHYGLRRVQEEVKINHAWNCYYRMSAYMHYFMPVHSIHHLKVEPDISRLETAGPSFPMSFQQAVLTAFFSNIWIRKMDKPLEATLNSFK